MKIAIITTHPIQYHAPLFAFLSNNAKYDIKVFYTLGDQGDKIFDKNFGIERTWNLDLLSGYKYEFLDNTSPKPSSDDFFGIQNASIITCVNAYKPNAILVYGWKYHSHLKLLWYFKGKVPILFRGDSTTLDDTKRFPLFNGIKYLLLRWVYRHVDYVLSPGKASNQYFQSAGVLTHNIIHAPHCVDNDRFQLFPEEESNKLNELRNNLFISNKDFVFLFAGKFIEKKNPLLLLKAFAKIATEDNCVRLLIVGSGILEMEMRNQAATLPIYIQNKISFLPFQDQQQMKIIYRLASVFVLPSISETWGLSVNESMVSGTPVIVSSKCGCAYDLVKHNTNGLIFESNNLEDLVEKMTLISKQNIYIQIKSSVNSELDNFSFRTFQVAFDKVISQIEN